MVNVYPIHKHSSLSSEYIKCSFHKILLSTEDSRYLPFAQTLLTIDVAKDLWHLSLCLGQGKKNPVLGPDRPLFPHLLIFFFFFFFLTNIWKENCERSEQEKIKIFSFFQVILATKCKKKKKIVPTNRLLFGISSPVEQGVFFSVALARDSICNVLWRIPCLEGGN